METSNRKVKMLFTFFIILLIFPTSLKAMENLEGILTLNPHNIDDMIEQTSKTNLFLFFHNTKSTEDLLIFDKYFKEFKKAYQQIKSSNLPINFGIVDNANYESVSKRLGAEEFPSYKFLIAGAVVHYLGGISAEDILYFLQIKQEPSSKEFYIPEDLDNFLENKEVLVFFGTPTKDNPKYLQFLEVTRNFDDVLFAHCGMMECIEHYRIEWNELIFFKKHINRSFELKDPYTDYMIRKLVEDNYTKTFTTFDQWVADFIFVRNNVGLFVFVDKENPEHAKYQIITKRASKYFKGIIYFLLVDIKSEYETELAKITKISKSDLPCVYLYDARKEEIFKYKLEDEITETKIVKFAIDFGMNKLTPFYSSQNPVKEEEQPSPVRILVGKTFEQEIMNNTQDYIFVYFYGDECKHCHKAGVLFQEFAEVLLQTNKNIKFYNINYDKNEIPLLDVYGYPNMKLFLPTNRKIPVDYPIDQDRSMKRIAQFLKSQITNLNIQNFTDKLDDDFEISYDNSFSEDDTSIQKDDL